MPMGIYDYLISEMKSVRYEPCLRLQPLSASPDIPGLRPQGHVEDVRQEGEALPSSAGSPRLPLPQKMRPGAAISGRVPPNS